MQTKTCVKCGDEKPISSFHKSKGGILGVRTDCKSCNVKRVSEYTKANADSVRQRKSKYRKLKAIEISAYRAAYYADNRDKMIEYSRAYAERNKVARAATQSNRRALAASAIPAWFGELDEFVISECAALRREREAATGMSWQVDHMIPLQAKNACGLHCAANLQVIPSAVNISKRNKLIFIEPFEWLGNGN